MGRFLLFYIEYTSAMKEQKPYPSIGQGFALILVAIIIDLVIAFGEKAIEAQMNVSISKGGSTLILYVLSMLVLVLYARQQRKKSGITAPLGFRAFSPLVLIIGIVSVFCTGYMLELFQYYVPVPDMFKELMEEALGNNVYSVLTAVVAAPILEELLMRGIVLDGFLKRYSPSKSIVWSAVIFGVFHMNPWQAVAGIATGLILGWLYWKTRSLWLCMLLHAFNNGVAMLQSYMVDTDAMPTFVDYLGVANYFIGFVAALLILIGCMRLLMRHFKDKEIPGDAAGDLPM